MRRKTVAEMNINGHNVERVKDGELRCLGCGLVGNSTLFATGVHGCPGDPASFNISVCPGGDQCAGHMIHDSAEYRAWKEIPSASADSVPRYHHDPADTRITGLAYRAASAYIAYADSVGVKLSVWSQEGYRVGPEGGKCAEMTFRGKPWSVWVDGFGKITARPGN
jgi:hypothetical protein